MVSKIIVALVLFVAIVMILERVKQKKSGQQVQHERPQAPPTADEVGPTQTGRFRVQQMMNSTERWAQKSHQSAELSSGQGNTSDGELVSKQNLEDEEEVLPDHFDGDRSS